MAVPSTSKAESEALQEMLAGLPTSSLDYAFAYGSGAIQQRGEVRSDKMLDLIVVTRDPLKFHTENLARNTSHYSLIRMCGPRFLHRLQTGFAARLYYNPHVKLAGRLCKYGVISTDDLISDLLDWKWLYAAGRLHKPVQPIRPPCERLVQPLADNLQSALHASLLLLPDTFSLEQLFTSIVSLSYTGDFRMSIGEDKQKIAKIVEGGYEHLLALYIPLLTADPRVEVKGSAVLQDASTPAVYHRLNLLPSSVLNRLCTLYNRRYARQRDIEEVLFSQAHRHDVSSHVSTAIRSLVAPAAIRQTAKNALTAGVVRSVVYSMTKLSKMLKSSL